MVKIIFVPKGSDQLYRRTHFIQWLKQQYPDRPLGAVGFSLGGNMLAKYLGEQGDNSLLDAAVVISAPLRLSPCAQRINKRFSKVYQKYLLDMLKQSMLKKLDKLKGSFALDITAKDINGLRTIKEFDDEMKTKLGKAI